MNGGVISLKAGGYCTAIIYRPPQNRDMKSLNKREGSAMRDLHLEPGMAFKRAVNLAKQRKGAARCGLALLATCEKGIDGLVILLFQNRAGNVEQFAAG